MAVSVEFLNSVPYLSGLKPDELDSVRKVVFERAVDRGEVIFLEGDPAEALYFVVSGVVKVFKLSADGKEQILELIRPGESFNDVPFSGGGVNLASAEALGPVVLYGIKKGDLDLILRDYPQVAVNVIKVLSRKVQQLLSLVEDLSFRNVTGRVARILLEHAGDGTGLGPRLTQQEMAAMAGTAREMVGRSLKDLEREGIVRLEHHRIVITNLEALRKKVGVAS